MVNFWHASCIRIIAALVILHYKAASRIDIGVDAGEMPRRLVRAFPNSSGLPWIFMSAPLSCRSAWTGFRPTSIRPTLTKKLAGKPMLSMRPPSGSMSVSRISSRKTLSSCSMAAGCFISFVQIRPAWPARYSAPDGRILRPGAFTMPSQGSRKLPATIFRNSQINCCSHRLPPDSPHILLDLYGQTVRPAVRRYHTAVSAYANACRSTGSCCNLRAQSQHFAVILCV
jgi:hypothetical protein